MAALAEIIGLALFPLARSEITTPSTAFFARMRTYYRFSQNIQMSLHCTVAALSQCSLMVTLRSGMSWCAKEKLLRECSGWRPDYWEYTKAHYNPQGTPQQWFDALSRTTGEYNEHLKGERCLWVAHEFPASPAEYPSK
jgi:hypothetical protein